MSCAFLLQCVSISAAAELGIKFDEMPIGCSWTFRYRDGVVWQERFIGEKNGYFVTQVYELSQARKSLKLTKNYNLEGLVVSRRWKYDNASMYDPHDCQGVLGECSFLTKRTNGKSFTTRTFSTVEENRIMMEIIEDGERMSDVILEVGPFNVVVSLTDVGLPAVYEVTMFSDCHLLS
jgi:hypothetical protein